MQQESAERAALMRVMGIAVEPALSNLLARRGSIDRVAQVIGREDHDDLVVAEDSAHRIAGQSRLGIDVRPLPKQLSRTRIDHEQMAMRLKHGKRRTGRTDEGVLAVVDDRDG